MSEKQPTYAALLAQVARLEQQLELHQRDIAERTRLEEAL
jgi:hypothetical protein